MATRFIAQHAARQAVQALVKSLAPAAKQAGEAARKVIENVQEAVQDAASGNLALDGERMSRVDTAWLRMDCASNLMMILGVWVLRPGIGIRDLRERIEERLLKYPRFTQRVVQGAVGARWLPDASFDVTNHVVTEKLARKPQGREQEALQDRLALLAVEPLHPDRPLWQFHLVENYQGGSAMMVRIHHCIADGIALIHVTQSLVDGGAEPPGSKRSKARRDGLQGTAGWLADRLIEPFTKAAVSALDRAGEGAVNALGKLRKRRIDVEKSPMGPAELAHAAYQVMRDAASLALMADDSPTRLKGTPGNTKRVAWCSPIPLEDVKAVGKALNCSINDVLLSCVAGAIARYLRSHGDEVTGKEIRAMVPVNLRPMEQAYKLGNRFGLAPVVLPIGLENPVERAYEIRRRMARLKGSKQPLMAFGLLAIAGLVPKPAQDAMLSVFSRKTTAVMTNVPGPREKLKFLGSTLEQSLFWVPQGGTVGLGVSILSYGGGVQFGVITDGTLCPDPQKIIDGFEPEFAKLSLLTLMLPWGD